MGAIRCEDCSGAAFTRAVVLVMATASLAKTSSALSAARHDVVLLETCAPPPVVPSHGISGSKSIMQTPSQSNSGCSLAHVPWSLTPLNDTAMLYPRERRARINVVSLWLKKTLSFIKRRLGCVETCSGDAFGDEPNAKQMKEMYMNLSQHDEKQVK